MPEQQQPIGKGTPVTITLMITIIVGLVSHYAWISSEFAALKESLYKLDLTLQNQNKLINDSISRPQMQLWIERTSRQNPTLKLPEFPPKGG